jgi:hypothetical protein
MLFKLWFRFNAIVGRQFNSRLMESAPRFLNGLVGSHLWWRWRFLYR